VALTPVDYDPFAGAPAPASPTPAAPRAAASGPKLTPVDFDPFAGTGPSTGRDPATGQMLFPSSFVETPADPLGDMVAAGARGAQPFPNGYPPLRREFADAAVKPVAPAPTTSNWLAGAGARVNSLLGSFVRGAANASPDSSTNPIGFVVPAARLFMDETNKPAEFAPYYALADWLEQNAAAYGYVPGTDIAQVKEALNPGANAARAAAAEDFSGIPGAGYDRLDPLERIKTVLAFMGEQGVVSSPDMAAAVAALPAYLLARTEEIGERRVELNNPGVVDAGGTLPEPGLGDLAAAAPAAVIESLLERFATGRLLAGGGPTAGNALGRIAQEGGIQTVTEAI
jgi:hypothetical protein